MSWSRINQQDDYITIDYIEKLRKMHSLCQWRSLPLGLNFDLCLPLLNILLYSWVRLEGEYVDWECPLFGVSDDWLSTRWLLVSIGGGWVSTMEVDMCCRLIFWFTIISGFEYCWSLITVVGFKLDFLALADFDRSLPFLIEMDS